MGRVLMHTSSDFSKDWIRYWYKFTQTVRGRAILSDPNTCSFYHTQQHHCESTQDNQLSSVPQSCPTLCNPMDCSMPGCPVHHQLLKLTQTHVHWVCDAIQPSYPLSMDSPGKNTGVGCQFLLQRIFLFFFPEDLSNPGIEPESPARARSTS